MTTAIKQVYSKALHLAPVERAELVEMLISSFDIKPDKAIDTEWAEESESRIDAFEHGKIGSRPVGHMFAAIQRRRKK